MSTEPAAGPSAESAGPPVTVDGRAWLTLVAMTGSLSMVMLDQTVVSVALPTMTRELPLSASGQQWVVNAYVLAMAALVAVGGKLGSKVGPVTTFKIGVCLFFVGSVFCGLAPHGDYGQEWIVSARVVQGVGAALMMPVSASIVMAAFPVTMRGRAMAVYVGISQIFLALGPLLGGALTEWVSWRAVFWLNVPVGLLALTLVARARPDNPKRPELAIRPISVALMATGIGLTVYTLQQSTGWGEQPALMSGLLVVGVALIAVFVVTQVRATDPLVDVRLFSRRAFLGDSVVLFVTQFSMLAIVLFSTLYFQDLLHFSPMTAGLATMPVILSLMIAAQVAGRWYDRAGVRAPSLIGLAVATVGVLVWAFSLREVDYLWNVPGMVLTGLGLGLVFSPVNTDALGRVEPSERPQASGLVQTVRQLGGTLGIAVIGAVVLAGASGGTQAAHSSQNPSPAVVQEAADAIARGFFVAAAVFAIGLLLAWWLLSRERVTESGPREPAVG